MKQISIDDVRKLINRLIGKGYDKKIPERRTEQEILVSYEVSSGLVLVATSAKAKLDEACMMIENSSNVLSGLLHDFRINLQPYLSTTPKMSKRTESSTLDFDSLFQAFESIDNDEKNEFEVDCGYLDSDEEERLYDELDNLMEAQERAFAFKGNANKFMANAFQKIFLRIQDLEDSFSLVCTR